MIVKIKLFKHLRNMDFLYRIEFAEIDDKFLRLHILWEQDDWDDDMAEELQQVIEAYCADDLADFFSIDCVYLENGELLMAW